MAKLTVVELSSPSKNVALVHELDTDEVLLEKMGYKQELRRGFSALMNFSFCFTAVSVISSLGVLYGYGLVTGGPAVIIWGWVIGSFFTLIIGFSMAEICSTYPHAGSVYYWAGQLAPAKWSPLFSYICGWFNFLGNAAGCASFAMGFSSAVAAVVLLGTGTEVTEQQMVGISIGVVTVWSVINYARVDEQGWLNITSALWQVGASVIIVIVILAMPSSRQTPEFVFTSTYNDTGFESFVYVAFIGLLTCLFALSGYEAGGHMAEETKNGSASSPKGIYWCCIVSTLCGFVFLLGLLFSCSDIDAVAAAEISGSSIIDNFYFATNVNGAIGLGSLLVVNYFFAGTSSFTVATRICFAMARDGGIPFSSKVKYVSPATKAPLGSVIVVLLLVYLLLLIGLGSSTAFAAITSITVIGFQISYAIPILLRVTAARHTFETKDFSLGKYAIPMGWIASMWLIGSSVLFFLPAEYPVELLNMNWACVVVGGTAIIGGVFWMLVARHKFRGPLRAETATVVHESTKPFSS